MVEPVGSKCRVYTAKIFVSNFVRSIKIICPCVYYPLTPHFYIVKLGFTGVYIISLFLLQNIDCGYSLEPSN